MSFHTIVALDVGYARAYLANFSSLPPPPQHNLDEFEEFVTATVKQVGLASERPTVTVDVSDTPWTAFELARSKTLRVLPVLANGAVHSIFRYRCARFFFFFLFGF
mgnify:CR=1 FL=1